MTIRYYSTNRNLDQVPGITPFKQSVSFREALLQGQAPDEGLYMPDPIPVLDVTRLAGLKGAPYAEAAKLVARIYLKDEIALDLLDRLVEDAYNFTVPLEKVMDRKYIMRLDRGPTASFKDFAARLMARLMSAVRVKGQTLHVLVATSGDT
ncbi:MAG TPA: threonine synthase, partial [Desulfobacterales bacterium]|nr:threonine synthase [Desulfobacterales bacterium]